MTDYGHGLVFGALLAALLPVALAPVPGPLDEIAGGLVARRVGALGGRGPLLPRRPALAFAAARARRLAPGSAA